MVLTDNRTDCRQHDVAAMEVTCGFGAGEGQVLVVHNRFVRGAGAVDILIAVYAIVNDATVPTADHDFDHIARVAELHHEYIVTSA